MRNITISPPEISAAQVIQRSFRKSRLLVPWRLATKMVAAIIPVQSLLRGVMTRKLVARWHAARTSIVTAWQARIRRIQSNKHVRPRLAKELKAACEIQRIIRGKLARSRCWRLRANIAAERIQCMWRGTVARVRADMMWLNRVVIPIQCITRKKIAKRMVKAGLAEVNAASLKIQQSFRAWKSKVRLGEFLHARELDYRLNQVAALTSEEEYVIEQLGKLAQRISKGTVKKKLDDAIKDLFNDFDEIYMLENDLIESRRQREILSPRAIQQGWVKELDQGAIEFREKLTNMKLNCLFNNNYKVALLEMEVERRVEEVVAMGAYRDKLRIFREQEYADRRDRYYEREMRAHRKARRMAIADERRKWRLIFYTKDGKPDKKRRPGRPWDPTVIAKEDKMTYTGAGVDLLAFENDSLGLKPGSKEAVTNALNQLSLQTYLEQMNHYEQLLNPISEIMQKTLGAPPRADIPPEELGFGPLGAELPHALSDIGAIPEFWGHGTKAKSGTVISESLGDSDSSIFSADMSSQSLGPLVDRKNSRKLLIKIKKSASASEYEQPTQSSTRPLSKEDLPALKDVNVKRRQRTRERRKSPAVIPWALLDELDGEKKRFENEKSFIEFTYKY